MELVKKNLSIAEARREQDSEALKKAERLAKLKAKKEALDAQIAASRASIAKLRTQSSTTNMEIALADRNREELQKKLDEQDVKTVLLEAYEKQVSRVNTQLHHYHSRISQILSDLQSSVQQPKTENGENGNEKAAERMEKEEMALFSDLYSHICEYLSREVDASNITSAFDVKKVRLPTDLEGRLAEFCARPGGIGSLLTRLAMLSKSETDQLESSTERVDISSLEEAALLRLESENLSQLGNSIQVSSSTLSISSPRRSTQKVNTTKASFPTVDELLQQQRSEHVTRFLDTEKSLNAAHALKSQRDTMLEDGDRYRSFIELKKQMENSILPNAATLSENSDPNLTSSFSLSTTDFKVDLHTRVQNFELLVCSEETACEASTLVVEKLKDTKRRLERDLKVLKEKFQRIQQLDSENRERYELCLELVRLNASTKSVFEAQGTALRNFVNSNLVDAQRQQLRDIMEEGETGSLSSGVMAHEMASLQQMTMISSSALEKDISQLVSHVAQHLELKANQSIDNLVSTVVRELLEVEQAKNLQLSKKANLESALASFAQWNDEGAIMKLKAMTEQLEKQQSETWLPLLEQSIQQVSKAAVHCDSIQQLCSDFILQPAQHLAPWLKLDGQNFDSTMKNWKSMSHTLRQHQRK